MNISNPTIIRINDRCYRCLHPTNFKQRSKTPTKVKNVIADEYDDEEISYLEDFAVGEPVNIEEKLTIEEDESKDRLEDDNDPIMKLVKNKVIRTELYNGQHLANIHVPNPFRGYLIGKNCSNIKEICSKFKVQIDFPQMNTNEPFIIIGPNEQSVKSAYQNIYQLVTLKRIKTNLTHFLSIQCYNDEIKSNYDKFKSIVQSKYLPQSFPEEVFIGRGKLHLTITCLALLDNFERNKMVSFMSKNLRKLIDDMLEEYNLKEEKGYRFKIKGLDYFGDDPSSVKILYGCVEDNKDFLQKFVDKINEATIEFGLAVDIRSKVRLHMTLMNIRYMPNSKLKQGCNSMDITEIMKDLKDFYFGTVDLKEIHLSITGTMDEKTEAYKFTHKIDIF